VSVEVLGPESLQGIRAVITGASSGLGAHAVRRLARSGGCVLAVARRTDRLAGLERELEGSPGRMLPWTADITEDAHARLSRQGWTTILIAPLARALKVANASS